MGDKQSILFKFKTSTYMFKFFNERLLINVSWVSPGSRPNFVQVCWPL